ncbi:MAG: CusA/CzcA family heavy metal efflux RND transporter [Candidatus Manganitrophus sp. SA1]|nr:CusA/CzcA family heavy metal efflux RND transporter [Candidatus Manganitrophus morganii]
MLAKIIEYSAKNKFLVLLMIFFLSAWGIWAMPKVPLDAIPDLSDVQVIIYTEWPGRSPDLVEDQITYPVVTSMIAAPKVKNVRGQSMLGFSFVYVIFEDDTDLYWARSRVLEYLQGVADKLPEGVTPRLGPDATGVGWVYQYALVDETGRHDLADLRSFQDWTLRYWLQSVPGVAEIASIGGFVKQYQVNIDPNKLSAYNLSLREVTEKIRMSNDDVGGRVIEQAGREYMVRGRGYIQSLEDLRSVVLGTNPQGTPIRVSDVARVSFGPDIRRGVVELDGKGEAVGGIVVMRYGANALEVIEGVKAKLREIEPSLPEGMKIIPTYDRSELIHASIDTLKKELIKLAAVVSVVTAVFLFHLPSAFVAIITLPVAILISFILMYYLGITSNIMSLGGIAIAIGAMVDSSIVMVENAHKRLERWEAEGSVGSRNEVIISAAKEVGPALFFALLIISVAFLPIFVLQGQEGRLFSPLAYTKTFAMFFSAFLAITLTPVLMVLFIRGKIRSEAQNPISRFLIAVYDPALRSVLRWPKTMLALTVLLLLSTIPVFLKLGSEFMPPLNEGSILYMPTTLPGISITEATRILSLQDRMLKEIPEVERVFGKIGQAQTPTDPAPLSMTETTITLKPKDQWRPGMTWEKLIDEMDKKLQFPGMPNIWWMPIQTRTEMLATGVRSSVGIKILGSDLNEIEEIGLQIEGIMGTVPGTRSAFFERVTGGYYLDFKIDRREAARYGLTVEEIEEVIESAVGGKNISQVIAGRARYPINVRYSREYRDDLEKLKRIFVAAPSGAQIPLAQVAEIGYTEGPPMIKNENGMLSGTVFVDVAGRDLGGFVQEAKKVVSEKVKMPPGYALVWAGQYEYLERAKAQLMYVVPLTLLIVFLLLYLHFKSVQKSLIIFLAIPFSLIGATWTVYLLGYNMSVAVWVGIIALAGVDAETGVVMVLYLDEAFDRRRREGKMTTLSDLYAAVMEGAVQRVRPKLMTVSTTIAGLVPILWSTGAGADVMKRIAAPMVGGMVSAAILELLVLPVIYILWRKSGLGRERRERPEESSVILSGTVKE